MSRETERGRKKEGKEAGKKEKRGSGAAAGRGRGKCRDVLSREPVHLVLPCPEVRLWALRDPPSPAVSLWLDLLLLGTPALWWQDLTYLGQVAVTLPLVVTLHRLHAHSFQINQEQQIRF